MHWQDRFSEWLSYLFRFNTITESEPDPFVEGLKEKGCHYNEDEDCWERVWVVATKNGSERSREVYKPDEDGWRVVMYGDKGDVFFEHRVDGTE